MIFTVSLKLLATSVSTRADPIFPLTRPLIPLTLDTYRLDQSRERMGNFTAFVNISKELTRLMFHYSFTQGYNLERKQRGKAWKKNPWLENQIIRCYRRCLNQRCPTGETMGGTAMPPNTGPSPMGPSAEPPTEGRSTHTQGSAFT